MLSLSFALLEYLIVSPIALFIPAIFNLHWRISDYFLVGNNGLQSKEDVKVPSICHNEFTKLCHGLNMSIHYEYSSFRGQDRTSLKPKKWGTIGKALLFWWRNAQKL